MSQMDWKYLRELAAGTLQDVSISIGDKLRDALWKLQGQLDPLKARVSSVEMNTQGSVLKDLTGASSPYYLTEEESKKQLLIFFQDVSSPGMVVYLFDAPDNPSIYMLYNCSDYPIDLVVGGDPQTIPPAQWTQLAYGYGGASIIIEMPHNPSDGDYGDLTVSSGGAVWTIDNAVIDYAKLTTGLKALIDGKIDATEKGAANGVTPLNAASKIDTIYLPDSVLGALKFKGFWNATTNIITSSDPALNGGAMPAASTANEGYYFITQVAGGTNVSGITDWKVGDWVISYGTAWNKIDNTDAVSSVNSKTGIVTLNTDEIPEGATNLYFTVARAIAAITNTTHGSLVNAATSKPTPVDADLVGVMDSTAAFVQRKTTWGEFKATLAAYFITLYLTLPNANGIAVRTSATTAVARTLTGTGNQISIANGDGVAGDPTFSVPATFIAPGSVKATTTLEVGSEAPLNLPNWVLQATADVNSYTQMSLQNKNAGAAASSDVVLTADNGSDTTNFIDMGINSSVYNQGFWTISGALDGYLYTASSHLSLGTGSAKDLIFHTGGTLAANIRLRIMADGEWRLNNGGASTAGHVLTAMGANQVPVFRYPLLDTYTLANITTDYNITSTSYAVINAAVRLSSPPAGRYLVLCTAQLSITTNDVDAWLGLHAGTPGSTTLLPEAECPIRPREAPVLAGAITYESAITVAGTCIITAGQVIEPKVKSASGQITVLNVSMIAVRIG